jgi:4-amino-4-deoxy-L-arabinose transferase-like glycosyltransferase
MFAALLLAAAFLTKGPVAFIVCGGGGLALLLTDPQARAFVRQRWRSALMAIALFCLLALPWFIYVSHLYPEQSARELGKELAARRFFTLSPVPLYGILLLALPWSFVAIAQAFGLRALDPERRRQALMLLIWLALSLLPFFFIKTFERYLYGSLVPLALLLGDGKVVWTLALRWAARFGMLFTLAAALPLLALALWLNGPEPGLLLGVPALAGFVWVWWKAKNRLAMSLAAAIAWVCIVGLAYPRLGINRIPAPIVEASRDRLIAFYDGPQPAMLPALLGRQLAHANDSWRLPPAFRERCQPFIVFARHEQAADAMRSLRKQGFQVSERTRFGVLSARVSWARMARRGITSEDVFEALRQRDLAPIEPQVSMLDAVFTGCAK